MRPIMTALALMAVACGGTGSTTSAAPTTAATTTTTIATTTTTAPTTTTLSEEQIAQEELEADTALIVALFRDHSDSWFQSVEAGYESMVAHNYPEMGCTVEEHRSFWALAGGSELEYVVHQDTVQRQDDWPRPDTGEVPEGRIYVFQVTTTFTAPAFAPQETLEEIHATIVDGEAYFFFPCRTTE